VEERRNQDKFKFKAICLRSEMALPPLSRRQREDKVWEEEGFCFICHRFEMPLGYVSRADM